ncbi:hypothetical protein Bca52824_015526 [Brassica carinata]|uniref:Uncharacterized protein n=1 Tax=Brassica carinata TaxID=52824 RepID=A0A8X8B5G5_BRACI|nr:hypothetical protein Bca52824_015526 [Brassica carinata]
MKNIVEDIKGGGEVRFGSGLLFPDCRYGTSGKMNYACDEATLRGELKQDKDELGIVFWLLLGADLFAVLIFLGNIADEDHKRAREVTIPSMDFTVFNMTETRLSVTWDLLIRIPTMLPGFYACLEGDFKGDMDGAIMKNIVEDITARGEVRFGSGLLFPDCRDGTSGKMNYACDEATLRFKPRSQRDATSVENQTKCAYQP